MAVSQIKPHDGTDDIIGNDYLTPELHATGEIKTEIVIDIFGFNPEYSNSPLTYENTLIGKCINGNFTIDSTSDIRSSCSLDIILENDNFIQDPANYLWYKKLLRITKKYEYPNDKNMYPAYQWGDRIGLWNNNGIIPSDPSQYVIGWFVPNQGGYSYNANSRLLSMSCTDLMSFMTENRGGHLLTTNRFSGEYNGNEFYNVEYNEEEMQIIGYVHSKEIGEKVYDEPFKYSAGIVLEGDGNYANSMQQFTNYFDYFYYISASNPQFEVPDLWQEDYDNFIQSHSEYTPVGFTEGQTQAKDIYGLVYNLVLSHYTGFPYMGVNIRLQDDYKKLPYDIEFNGDVTLYDVLKKIVDLYPRQYMYFDSNLKLNLVQKALTYNDAYNKTNFKGREISGLVIDEQWNKNLENVKNCVVVFGRDNTCSGIYYISAQMVYCDNCYHTYHSNYNDVYEENETPGFGAGSPCPNCGSILKPLFTNNPFCVENYGLHKYVVYDDNYTTDEECRNAAKYIAWESCRCAETVSVTIADRYLSLYQWSDKGVGDRIEYTSKVTGETNLYTLLKWSNDINNNTVTLELEPWYPCEDEYYCLPAPTFTYTIDSSGNLEMIITNGEMTEKSLFKIYIAPQEGQVYRSPFEVLAGETCEVYDSTSKVFRYKFHSSGSYAIKCMAWSPNLHPSGFSAVQMVNVNITENRLALMDDAGRFILTDEGKYILYN